MKKIGQLDISFKEYKNGIYYYDVEEIVNDTKISVVLPRYHTFLGWIEIFGLPPQNEWVVLDEFDAFEKTGVLKVNNKEITETVLYTPENKSHTIKTIRQLDDHTETCTWIQNYSDAPESVFSKIEFEHKAGKYRTDWKTDALESTDSLSEQESVFASHVSQEKGQPDILIKKTFTASGELPTIYYSLFPIQNLLNLTNLSGSIVELGYLRKDSPHKVDRVHGDWYKRFDFGDIQLYIHETNYSSCKIETEKGPEQIKSTYRKELFR